MASTAKREQLKVKLQEGISWEDIKRWYRWMIPMRTSFSSEVWSDEGEERDLKG